MLLKTERLTIRHIVADDWKSIRDIWVDFNSSEYAQYDTPHITEDANVQARIAKWAAVAISPTWSIVLHRPSG